MSSSVLGNKNESNIQMLNEEQAAKFFENLVQTYLGMSADEFLKRYWSGEYKDACNNSRLLKVVMMIPKVARVGDHK
jgi:hypothetical protein